jgi:23S rRNA pseudouridine1911/1915/1917 synthase
MGHALVGDPVYGTSRASPGLPPFARQALHAARLALTHPITGERMTWEAPPPGDFAMLVAALRAPRP